MLKLVKLTEQYKTQFIEMMDEWISIDDDRTPWAIFKNDYYDFDYYVANLDVLEPRDGLVPDSTYFLLDTELNQLIGAINIRHALNEHLLKAGGHIGDGIRPTMRSKGYGTKMIRLGLEKCRELHINKVLMVCDKDNIASAKTIIKNGGILENEVEYNGIIIQRYWIDL